MKTKEVEKAETSFGLGPSEFEMDPKRDVATGGMEKVQLTTMSMSPSAGAKQERRGERPERSEDRGGEEEIWGRERTAMTQRQPQL